MPLPIASLLGGALGGGFDFGSSASIAAPFANTNSGIFFNSDVGLTDIGETSSSASTAGRPAQGGYNLQNDGATLPALSSSGFSSTYLLIAGVIIAVLGGLYFVFKK